MRDILDCDRYDTRVATLACASQRDEQKPDRVVVSPGDDCVEIEGCTKAPATLAQLGRRVGEEAVEGSRGTISAPGGRQAPRERGSLNEGRPGSPIRDRAGGRGDGIWR